MSVQIAEDAFDDNDKRRKRPYIIQLDSGKYLRVNAAELRQLKNLLCALDDPDRNPFSPHSFYK